GERERQGAANATRSARDQRRPRHRRRLQGAGHRRFAGPLALLISGGHRAARLRATWLAPPPLPRPGPRPTCPRGPTPGGPPPAPAIRRRPETDLPEPADLVTQPCRLFELEIGGGGAHALFEVGDNRLQVFALVMRRLALAEPDGDVVGLVDAVEDIGDAPPH